MGGKRVWRDWIGLVWRFAIEPSFLGSYQVLVLSKELSDNCWMCHPLLMKAWNLSEHLPVIYEHLPPPLPPPPSSAFFTFHSIFFWKILFWISRFDLTRWRSQIQFHVVLYRCMTYDAELFKLLDSGSDFLNTFHWGWWTENVSLIGWKSSWEM